MHSAKIVHSVEIKVCTNTWSQCDQNEINKKLKTIPENKKQLVPQHENQFAVGL
jgi:hypothetical protein